MELPTTKKSDNYEHIIKIGDGDCIALQGKNIALFKYWNRNGKRNMSPYAHKIDISSINNLKKSLEHLEKMIKK